MPSALIAGGGYAGVAVARRLVGRLDRSWTISVVDSGSHHELLTRLPELVAGRIGVEKVKIPFQLILAGRVDHIRARISDIDATQRTVRLDDRSIHADVLVLALGFAPSFHRVPGAREHGLTARSAGEAVRLRESLHRTLESHGQAHVLIIGAGYTATEVAGWLTDPLARHPPGKIEVTLVAEDARLLPQGNERLAAVAQQVLQQKGVRCRLATSVISVGPEAVELQDGSRIQADLIVWAASAVAGWPGSGGNFSFGSDRRIVVDDFLRTVGGEGIYVVGDCAAAHDFRTGAVVPANAQIALQEAETAADNILAELQGRRLSPFRPSSLGEALDLGGSDGVAEVLGVVLRGRNALRVKQTALDRYLFNLGGIRLLRTYR